MLNREEALKKALEAGISTLTARYGEGYDRSLVFQNVPLLLEVMWPYIEDYNERYTICEFEELFKARFPNHVLVSYGSTLFDYVAGNIQTAVVNEIILVLETWEQTIQEARALPKLEQSAPPHDWEVALAHTKNLVSEIKQYRTRGAYGHHSTHTGSVPVQEHANVKYDGSTDAGSISG